ncbi:MAG: tetraacyldisaccharide 4'-kinase [Mariprofundaceae bacterium]|nr:tetraacyldisaccharide 4'-kinase [Mariprofundaceae bacterium]
MNNHGLHQYMEHLWWQEKLPPLLLRWISRIYGCVNRWNLSRRKRHVLSPPVPLISVGNITVGGSGKTPFVIWLCKQLQQRGYKPVILCRGDGGKLNQPRVINKNDTAHEVGDEALLLARSCAAPVIAGRDRVAASIMAGALGDIIIFDDGFQYQQLERACDIVLIPSQGVGNGYLLPAGPLREPMSALSRADLVVRTGDGSAMPVTQIKEWRWKTQSSGLQQLQGIDTSTPEKIVAVCGIARPQRFLNSLEQQGVTVADQMIFPDHYRYCSNDIEQITGEGLPVVTTEKDAVKLTAIWPDKQPLWVLPLEGEGEEGLPEAIIQTILSRQT